jgi:hypothetical protein
MIRAITLVLALADLAYADPCTGESAAGRFATCFDPGNRLSITAGSDGFGGSIALRQVIRFDDEPDLVWKLEHTVLDATHAAFSNEFSGVLYRGSYMRHARDGHIVLPLGEPKKVFLHSDIGGFAEVGSIEWRDTPTMRIGVIKIGGLTDFARRRDFSRRLAFGPVARWDIDVMHDHLRSVAAQIVAPMTTGVADLRFESANGRLLGDLRVEAGAVWRSDQGWVPDARAEASVERIMLAVNDRPISIVVGARYTSETNEALAHVCARVVLLSRRDPRVSL